MYHVASKPAALVQQTKAAVAGVSTIAVVSVSSKAVRTLASELKAFTSSARGVNVTAVPASETWILLRKCA